MQPPTQNGGQRAPRILKGMLLLTILSTLLSVSLLVYTIRRSDDPRFETAPSPQPTVVNAGANYDAQSEIRGNLRRLEQKPGTARVIGESESTTKKIELTIDGMLDEVTMLRILDTLHRYDATASFFISGTQASSEPAVVKAIAQAGQPVGNYTLRARKQMEALEQTELVEDFSIATTIFKNILDAKPPLLKANATEYSPGFLEAAQACGYNGVVQSTEYLTYHSFRSYDEVQAYVDKLAFRSIVSIKLSGVLDPSEYTPKEIIERPSIDLQPGAQAQSAAEPELAKEERLLRMIEWLLQAIQRTNFSPETIELRQANGGTLAQPRNALNTTEAAVGYAFCGLSRMDELVGTLDSLEAAKGVGTFFVSAKEIESYPEQIKMLLSRGHSIGIAYYPKQGEDYYAISHQLLQAKKLLETYGYHGAKLVMQPWGEIDDDLKEAVSALKCMLIGYDIAFARTDNREARTVREVVDSVYGQNTYGLRRGTVAFFRMNYFDRSGLLSELLTGLEGTRNPYRIKDIYLLWSNDEQIYAYPLPEERILPEVRGKIAAGQLDADVMELASNRYIGNKDIASRAQLPDFTNAEIHALDKTGKIANSERTAFLTFDDWGTDVNITKLLRVLEKHGVKATFFVRTEYVADNPNLLRAIALAGHEIASHTHTHIPLAHDLNGKWRFTPISREEALALQADMEQSYKVLESIVGDIRLDNGKPALSRLFRPPTMAVCRMGMWAVFDCGFTYIVNGAYTSRDYAAPSAERLARDLRYNVRAGSIVILHISDNSIHTAGALDQYLAYLKSNPASARLKFARLSDYLGK